MTENSGRADTWRILKDVVGHLNPVRLVADAIQHDGRLQIRDIPEEIEYSGRLIVIAVGKAAVPMISGALTSLDGRVDQAIAVTKAGIPLPVDPPPSVELLEADHPVPSEASVAAGKRIRELVTGLNEDDLILMLISGGGSALIEDLVEGVSLDDLQRTTDHLLRAGATINELNSIRRRISLLKGGRLARAAAPARIINLIVSDVLNSPLQDIASGPTVEPPDNDNTFAAVMQRPEFIDALPSSVRQALDEQETRSEKDLGNVVGSVILADAETAARAAIDSAVGLGYRVQTLGFDFQGEAREFGKTWATIARHALRVDDAFELPLALVGTGELTVTVKGDGSGGRNTEMALSAALEIQGVDRLTIASFATDGDDGMANCAGGIVDGSTVDAAEAASCDPAASLDQNDSATLLHAIDEAIDIGPTGTNVNDLYLALVQAPQTRR